MYYAANLEACDITPACLRDLDHPGLCVTGRDLTPASAVTGPRCIMGHDAGTCGDTVTTRYRRDRDARDRAAQDRFYAGPMAAQYRG